MNQQPEEKGTRRPYEAPSVIRVIIDPVKEMLTACEASPGKTFDINCSAIGS